MDSSDEKIAGDGRTGLKRFRSLQGSIAIAHLGIVIGLVMWLRSLDPSSTGLVSFIQIALLVLTFPIGWVPQIFQSMHPTKSDVVFLVVCTALNSLFVGLTVARVIRWWRRPWKEFMAERES